MLEAYTGFVGIARFRFLPSRVDILIGGHGICASGMDPVDRARFLRGVEDKLDVRRGARLGLGVGSGIGTELELDPSFACELLESASASLTCTSVSWSFGAKLERLWVAWRRERPPSRVDKPS